MLYSPAYRYVVHNQNEHLIVGQNFVLFIFHLPDQGRTLPQMEVHTLKA